MTFPQAKSVVFACCAAKARHYRIGGRRAAREADALRRCAL